MCVISFLKAGADYASCYDTDYCYVYPHHLCTVIRMEYVSVSCVPPWSGMCREFSVSGADYAGCSGVYRLATDMTVNDRPAFVHEGGWRFLSFRSHWVMLLNVTYT